MKTIPAWILVQVKSGIPTAVKAFQNESQAKYEEERVRNTLNLENDETGVFQIEVPIEER